MAYRPVDFAKHHYPNYRLRADVSAALLERPNWGFTAEELNRRLGRESSKTDIEGVRRVLRELTELELIEEETSKLTEVESRKPRRGPPIKNYKPGKLLESYRDPILNSVFGEGREESRDTRICAYFVPPTDPAVDAQIHALEARARGGDDLAFEELVEILSKDLDECARAEAARALGRLQDDRAIEALDEAMLNEVAPWVESIMRATLNMFPSYTKSSENKQAVEDMPRFYTVI